MTVAFEGELRRVAGALAPHMDPPPDEGSLRAAIAEIVVAIPVYRTYGDPSGFRPDDLALLDEALERAAENGDGALMADVLKTLGQPEAWEARARFQQLSGPAMAKAVEDTLFYRHNALIARNEVGCDPIAPPGGAEAVHGAFAARVEEPHALNATATHDTKRGEGARTRLYTLAEAPGAWIQAFDTWRTEDGPRRERQWLFLQALAGAWPSEPDPDLGDLSGRFEAYVEKALREAKRRTSWTDPDEAYEARVIAWAHGLLSDQPFVTTFQAALDPYIAAGHVGTLVQTVLKVAAPGVPDVYQGTEAEDLSLVDPDNRRPPDFDRLAELIGDGSVVGAPPDRRHALVLRRALAARGGTAGPVRAGRVSPAPHHRARRLRLRAAVGRGAGGGRRPDPPAGAHGRRAGSLGRGGARGGVGPLHAPPRRARPRADAARRAPRPAAGRPADLVVRAGGLSPPPRTRSPRGRAARPPQPRRGRSARWAARPAAPRP